MSPAASVVCYRYALLPPPIAGRRRIQQALRRTRSKHEGPIFKHRGISSDTTTSSSNSDAFSTKPSSENFVDPALTWGRNNPKLAEQCLAIPTQPPSSQLKLTTLEDYWEWRQWKFSVVAHQDLTLAQALVSHVLSAPLTLAKFYNTLHKNAQPFHACCVGARAEATLPLEYWREFLVAIYYSNYFDKFATNNKDHTTTTPQNNHNHNPPPIHLKLDFVGPDIHPQMPNQTLEYSNLKLHLQWLYQGYLHDYVNDAKNNNIVIQNWNAFVLFNPGLGHANLKQGWKPTLDYLLHATTSPLLLTAHSPKDAWRDWSLLQNEFGVVAQTAPQPNPFASRITYQDPFDASHQVQPNHSYVILD